MDLRTWGRAPDGRHHVANLGFVTHPGLRGRGVMSRAVALVVGHALDPATTGGLGLDTLVWQGNVGNVASYKAVWRSGFPVPTYVPSLLPHRGFLVDGWHSPLHRGRPRRPVCPWEEAAELLARDVAGAPNPG